ncbi:MAG: two-component system nitrogen regulation response regulator GlnG [Mariniblastus sp.]|jgi:two-component system nitrogen regulation response regulator GlnG
MMPRLLIIDDEESICWGLSKLCSQMSIESDSTSTAEQGLKLALSRSYDAIIMDVRLPGMDGISAIEQFHRRLGNIPIITITAFGDLKTAIEAVQKGAFEYIVKPFELDTVQKTIQQAIATSKFLNGQADATLVENAHGDPGDEPNSIGLIGSSSIMQEVYKQIALTTTTQSPVLITGESGTGKELAARSIHRFGPRSAAPFVAVNIAALSPSLAESELFGHKKGAFTGAEYDRVGLIQQAHGGTLFLDEIAEIPLEIQVKLLRVLDLGEVTPVGSNTPVKTNFRLISATHQDLLSQVNHGEFRHDLLYRLRTFEIQLPPLRQRIEDIPELVRHFLRADAAATSPLAPISISDDFLDRLKLRSWPGNVRELQNIVARAATIARGGVLTAHHIDQDNSRSTDAPLDGHETQSLESEIQDLIAKWTRMNWDSDVGKSLYEGLLKVIDPAVLSTAFGLSDHQYSAAARRLGIHRTTLKKKLDEAND